MSARVLLTYDDYAALPDDGHRYELYEGELVMTPSPRTRHQVTVGNLYRSPARPCRRLAVAVTARPRAVLPSRSMTRRSRA